MFKKAHEEEQLEVGRYMLRASHSDDEILDRLETLTWVYSPFVGLVNGELGWLKRDIAARKLTIPGRTRSESLDLVYEAFNRSYERRKEINEACRKIERKMRWDENRSKVMIFTIIAASLAAFAIFHDALFAVYTRAAGTTEQQAWLDSIRPTYEVIATSVVPGALLFFGIAVLLGVTYGMVRRGRLGL